MKRENQLSPDHMKQLREESAISDEIIQARGYRTVNNPSELEALGFTRQQRRNGLFNTSLDNRWQLASQLSVFMTTIKNLLVLE